jgi:hypothetical protein
MTTLYGFLFLEIGSLVLFDLLLDFLEQGGQFIFVLWQSIHNEIVIIYVLTVLLTGIQLSLRQLYLLCCLLASSAFPSVQFLLLRLNSLLLKLLF